MELYAYPKLGERRIHQITAQDLLDTLEPILASTPTAAEKVRRYTSSVMARAVGLRYRTDNPAVDVKGLLPKNGHKVNHQAAMPHAEIGAYLARVRESSVYVGAIDALE